MQRLRKGIPLALCMSRERALNHLGKESSNAKKLKEPLAKQAALVHNLLRKVIGIESPVALSGKNDLK